MFSARELLLDTFEIVSCCVVNSNYDQFPKAVVELD